MSYDIAITPCPNSRYGWGKDIGTQSVRWAVLQRDGDTWRAVAHYNHEATAKSEANRRDGLTGQVTP